MKVIIDASNVAHFGKGNDGQPRLDNILEAIEALKGLGYEPFAIADAPLRHEIDKKEEFNKLLEDETIQQVPSGTTADHFILKIAYDENAKILSNDVFREYNDEFKDIASKRIPYSIKDGKIAIGTSSKPKKVKNILQKICTYALTEFEKKGLDAYKVKKSNKLSGIAIAKEAIDRINKTKEEGLDSKIEDIFMKIPLFDKVMSMVEEAERTKSTTK